MASPTNIYVDPSIAAASGAGTVGDPYGDLQHAFDTVTRDSTNGDQFNIKAGTDEILSSALSLATYGTPAALAPLILRGYTSAANDGGIGGISGNGSVSVWDSAAYNYIHHIDLHLHNTGSSLYLVRLNDQISFFNCELNNSSGSLGLDADQDLKLYNCYFHDMKLVQAQTMVASHCMFENDGTNDFTAALNSNSGQLAVLNCIMKLDGASDGIRYRANVVAIGNTIWSSSGTGQGITQSATNRQDVVILNNVVEGFSGTGGVGIQVPSGDKLLLYGNNAVYNCATNYDISGDVWNDLGSNETLLASPFTDAANGDFTVDTTVKATGYPPTFPEGLTDQALDKGAAQRAEPAATTESQQNLIVQSIGTY